MAGAAGHSDLFPDKEDGDQITALAKGESRRVDDYLSEQCNSRASQTAFR